jgi:hypothetical protein
MGEFGLGREHEQPREAAANRAVANILTTRIRSDFDREKSAGHGIAVAVRDAHPNHHAFVTARFIIDPSEAFEGRPLCGVFAERGREYRALIRFSASLPRKGPDTRSDLRGIAIKLLEVDGEKLMAGDDSRSQDFLLASSKKFFVRNAIDYVEFTVSFERGSLHLPWYFLRTPRRWSDGIALLRPTMWRPVAFRLNSLLRASYFSQTPYKWLDTAVKYRVEASDATRAVAPRFARKADTPQYLRDTMMRHLAAEHVVLDFSVQLQTDAERMPIEDPMVLWDEKESPFHKVATIIIPKQDFHTPAHWEWAEKISFTPWRGLSDHRPLGGINRTRRVVYEEISGLRRWLNRVDPVEPTAEDWEMLARDAGVANEELQLA